MSLQNLLTKATVGVKEVLEFRQLPNFAYGITDEKGYVHLVQAPALKYLKPNVPQDVNFRWVLKNPAGEIVAMGPVETRRVERRDSGIIPLFYFV